MACHTGGFLARLTTRPEPRGTACDTRYSAPFKAENLGMVGFPSVHGKGRVWGFTRKTQRWDEVTFLVNFSTRKINPEGRAESLRDRTALESHLSPSRAACPHHSQE